MMTELNNFLGRWEPLWLFLVLVAETVVGAAVLWWTIAEFKYDEGKDLQKKQRRTKTTKKTTNKAGESIVEETTETSEPIGESRNERDEPKV